MKTKFVYVVSSLCAHCSVVCLSVSTVLVYDILKAPIVFKYKYPKLFINTLIEQSLKVKSIGIGRRAVYTIVGFPLNIMSLMPVMMKQFDAPDQFCITCASNIQQVDAANHVTVFTPQQL